MIHTEYELGGKGRWRWFDRDGHRILVAQGSTGGYATREDAVAARTAYVRTFTRPAWASPFVLACALVAAAGIGAVVGHLL